MTLRGVIQYKNPPAGIARALRTKILKEANAATVEQWHDKYVPGHFEPVATNRYKYQRRRGEGAGGTAIERGRDGRLTYTARKKRQFGHTKPLVFSGRSRAIAVRQIRTTSTSKRGTGTFAGLPRYFYAYRKDQNQPDKAAELTRTTRKEVLDLARFHRELIRGKINNLNIRRTKKVA